jgi:hypothetical protein
VRKWKSSLSEGFQLPGRTVSAMGFFADGYDESLFALEIVGDYFLAKEEQ